MNNSLEKDATRERQTRRASTIETGHRRDEERPKQSHSEGENSVKPPSCSYAVSMERRSSEVASSSLRISETMGNKSPADYLNFLSNAYVSNHDQPMRTNTSSPSNASYGLNTGNSNCLGHNPMSGRYFSNSLTSGGLPTSNLSHDLNMRNATSSGGNPMMKRNSCSSVITGNSNCLGHNPMSTRDSSNSFTSHGLPTSNLSYDLNMRNATSSGGNPMMSRNSSSSVMTGNSNCLGHNPMSRRDSYNSFTSCGLPTSNLSHEPTMGNATSSDGNPMTKRNSSSSDTTISVHPRMSSNERFNTGNLNVLGHPTMTKKNSIQNITYSNECNVENLHQPLRNSAFTDAATIHSVPKGNNCEKNAPSQERKTSTPSCELDPLQTATKLMEKYYRETLEDKKELHSKPKYKHSRQPTHSRRQSTESTNQNINKERRSSSSNRERHSRSQSTVSTYQNINKERRAATSNVEGQPVINISNDRRRSSVCEPVPSFSKERRRASTSMEKTLRRSSTQTSTSHQSENIYRPKFADRSQLLRLVKQRRNEAQEDDKKKREESYEAQKDDKKKREESYEAQKDDKKKREESYEAQEDDEKKREESSSQSSSSESQSCTSRCNYAEDSQNDLVIGRKKDGISYIEIDLGDSELGNSKIPLSIECKDRGKKRKKEKEESSKKRNSSGKRNSPNVRNPNERSTAATDHLYDVCDTDDPIIGVVIPVRNPSNRDVKQKIRRNSLVAGQTSLLQSFKHLQGRKYIWLSLAVAAVITVSVVVYFSVTQGSSKSPSDEPNGGSYQSISTSINETSLNTESSSSTNAAQGISDSIDKTHSSNPVPSGGSAGSSGDETKTESKPVSPEPMSAEANSHFTEDFSGNPSFPTLQKVSGSTLTSPGSPQQKASFWLLCHDAMESKSDDARFLPRYGLATLYYALDGENWEKAAGWLGDDDICTWHGVCCLDISLENCEKTYNVQSIGLKLNHNNLSGTIPEEISILDLVLIDLEGNLVTGSLPSSLGNLIHLKKLNLDSNQIGGPIPNDWMTATGLVEISIHDNLLSGTIPGSLRALKKLELIDLGGNQLSGSIPNIFGEITGLKTLKLGTNKILGAIPETLYLLSQLTDLSLFENLLTGMLNDGIQNMEALQTLKLHTNKFTGAFPTSIGHCIKLESFQVHSNNFVGTIPTTLGEISSLKYLYLDNNHFTGKLPTELSKLPNLRYFDANGNSLTGPIPLLYGKLTSLRGLHLGNNTLTGSIPVSVNKLSQLQYLIIDNNKLLGSLPPSLWQLPGLAVLDLHQNGFTGSLPKTFLAESLQVLDLENNRLQDTIPYALLSAASLESAYFRWNEFVGTIDPRICENSSLGQLWMDCISKILWASHDTRHVTVSSIVRMSTGTRIRSRVKRYTAKSWWKNRPLTHAQAEAVVLRLINS